MLEQQAKRQQIELRATIRLQAALGVARRQSSPRKQRKRRRSGARQQWGTNREERAVGRVQRAWVASVARRREAEAEKQAETAKLLELRLARARASELRARHFAVLIAQHLKRYFSRRIEVAGALRGWLSKRVHTSSLAPSKWRRRYYWVSAGALRYDSVERRMAHLHGWPLRDLVEASALKRRGEFALVFRTADDGRHALRLRAATEADAAFWWRWMRWLAHLSTDGGPQLTPVPAASMARPQRQPPQPPSQPQDQLAALAALRDVEAARTGEDLVVASVQRRLIAAAHARVLAAQAAPPTLLPASSQQLLQGRTLPLHEIQPPPLQAQPHRRRRCGNCRCSRAPAATALPLAAPPPLVTPQVSFVTPRLSAGRARAST